MTDIEPSGMVSVVSLSVVTTVCVLGIFGNYRDNLAQRIGMCALAVWCVLRIQTKIMETGETDPVHLWMHIGLAIYALGAAWRQYRFLQALRACAAKDCEEFKIFWRT